MIENNKVERIIFNYSGTKLACYNEQKGNVKSEIRIFNTFAQVVE